MLTLTDFLQQPDHTQNLITSIIIFMNNTNLNQQKPIRRPSQSGLQAPNDMSSSGGFKGSKMKLSGSNFRPSSRDRQSLIQAPMVLQIIPLDQEEGPFCSNIKADLLSVQEEIDQLDIDRRLRTVADRNLTNTHSQQIKKWLMNQPDLARILESRVQSTMDPDNYIEYMGVQDVRQGFSKLLKMISMVDLYLQKVTELHCIHFLQNQATLSNISQSNKTFLEKISQQGIQPNRLHLSLSNLRTISDMMQIGNKQVSQEQRLQPSEAHVKQLILDNKELAVKAREKDDEIIRLTRALSEAKESIMVLQQLQAQQHHQIRSAMQSEQKMRFTTDSLAKENKKLQDQLSQSTVMTTDGDNSWLSKSCVLTPNQDPLYSIKVIDEVRETYSQLILNQQQEINELKQKLSDLQIRNEDYKTQLQENIRKLETLKELKDDLYKRFQQKYKSQEEFEESYEAALKEEYSRMQQAFEMKITSLKQELEKCKKEHQLQTTELKTQLDREVDKHRLIAKKLSLYMKV